MADPNSVTWIFPTVFSYGAYILIMITMGGKNKKDGGE